MIEELPDDIDNDELDDVEPVGDEAQLYEHFRVVVDKGQEMVRVDKYLFDRLTNSSRNRIQKAADAGFVMANGKAVKSSYKVKPMDVITVMMDRPRYENEVIPEDIPLDIVYEDKYLMVVNKPAGLVVHPGHGNYHGTLVNAIAWHMKDNPDYDANDPHVGLVHRIDNLPQQLIPRLHILLDQEQQRVPLPFPANPGKYILAQSEKATGDNRTMAPWNQAISRIVPTNAGSAPKNSSRNRIHSAPGDIHQMP